MARRYKRGDVVEIIGIGAIAIVKRSVKFRNYAGNELVKYIVTTGDLSEREVRPSNIRLNQKTINNGV